MNTNFKNNKLLVPSVIALIGAILMTISIFLPYATAINNRAEYIKEYPDEVISEKLNITADDMFHISMIEYANMYNRLSEELWGDTVHGIFYVVMVAMIGGFALFGVIFTFCKKPVVAVIFDLLSLGVFYLHNWDYIDRGVIPSSSYKWGMGYYIFYVAAVIAIAGAIWMIVAKIRRKKVVSE